MAGLTTPDWLHRQPVGLSVLVLGQPADAVEHGVVLGRRGQHPAPARVWPPAAAQYRPLMARLSASVPPLVKTTSLGLAP